MNLEELKELRRQLGSANADLAQAWRHLEECSDEVIAIAETEDQAVDLESNRELIMALVRVGCLQLIVNMGNLRLVEEEEEE